MSKVVSPLLLSFSVVMGHLGGFFICKCVKKKEQNQVVRQRVGVRPEGKEKGKQVAGWLPVI